MKKGFDKKKIALANYYIADGLLEAGCDEAGRGCLAGEVFAAAVVLNPTEDNILGLNDSKALSCKQRERLRPLIEERALAWAVARASVEEIDSLNILNASILAMHRAVAALSLLPQRLLIDGNRFSPYPDIPHECFVKGDARFRAIAAASVLAKTHRDEYMLALHQAYPQYGWDSNKGYPTKMHFDAIVREGLSPHHRKTFACERFEQSLLFDFSKLSTN